MNTEKNKDGENLSFVIFSDTSSTQSSEEMSSSLNSCREGLVKRKIFSKAQSKRQNSGDSCDEDFESHDQFPLSNEIFSETSAVSESLSDVSFSDNARLVQSMSPKLKRRRKISQRFKQYLSGSRKTQLHSDIKNIKKSLNNLGDSVTIHPSQSIPSSTASKCTTKPEAEKEKSVITNLRQHEIRSTQEIDNNKREEKQLKKIVIKASTMDDKQADIQQCKPLLTKNLRMKRSTIKPYYSGRRGRPPKPLLVQIPLRLVGSKFQRKFDFVISKGISERTRGQHSNGKALPLGSSTIFLAKSQEEKKVDTELLGGFQDVIATTKDEVSAKSSKAVYQSHTSSLSLESKIKESAISSVTHLAPLPLSSVCPLEPATLQKLDNPNVGQDFSISKSQNEGLDSVFTAANPSCIGKGNNNLYDADVISSTSSITLQVPAKPKKRRGRPPKALKSTCDVKSEIMQCSKSALNEASSQSSDNKGIKSGSQEDGSVSLISTCKSVVCSMRKSPPVSEVKSAILVPEPSPPKLSKSSVELNSWDVNMVAITEDSEISFGEKRRPTTDCKDNKNSTDVSSSSPERLCASPQIGDNFCFVTEAKVVSTEKQEKQLCSSRSELSPKQKCTYINSGNAEVACSSYSTPILSLLKEGAQLDICTPEVQKKIQRPPSPNCSSLLNIKADTPESSSNATPLSSSDLLVLASKSSVLSSQGNSEVSTQATTNLMANVETSNITQGSPMLASSFATHHSIPSPLSELPFSLSAGIQGKLPNLSIDTGLHLGLRPFNAVLPKLISALIQRGTIEPSLLRLQQILANVSLQRALLDQLPVGVPRKVEAMAEASASLNSLLQSCSYLHNNLSSQVVTQKALPKESGSINTTQSQKGSSSVVGESLNQPTDKTDKTLHSKDFPDIDQNASVHALRQEVAENDSCSIEVPLTDKLEVQQSSSCCKCASSKGMVSVSTQTAIRGFQIQTVTKINVDAGHTKPKSSSQATMPSQDDPSTSKSSTVQVDVSDTPQPSNQSCQQLNLKEVVEADRADIQSLEKVEANPFQYPSSSKDTRKEASLETRKTKDSPYKAAPMPFNLNSYAPSDINLTPTETSHVEEFRNEKNVTNEIVRSSFRERKEGKHLVTFDEQVHHESSKAATKIFARPRRERAMKRRYEKAFLYDESVMDLLLEDDEKDQKSAKTLKLQGENASDKEQQVFFSLDSDTFSRGNKQLRKQEQRVNLTKTGVVGKRKVGRPRKYPLMVQTKSEKAQSKSQAITDSPSLKMTFQKVGSSSDKNFILKETSMSSFMEAESKAAKRFRLQKLDDCGSNASIDILQPPPPRAKNYWKTMEAWLPRKVPKSKLDVIELRSSAREMKAHRVSKQWLAENNGWRWIGDPILQEDYQVAKRKGVLRSYFAGIQRGTKNPEELLVRDCVLVFTGDPDQFPYVGRIISFWQDSNSEEMMFTSCWYHRPVDGLGNEAGSSFFKQELFASNHRDDNPVASILSKCYVMGFNEYCRFHADNICYLSKVNTRTVNAVVPNSYCKEDEHNFHIPKPETTLNLDHVFYCKHSLVSARYTNSRMKIYSTVPVERFKNNSKLSAGGSNSHA